METQTPYSLDLNQAKSPVVSNSSSGKTSVFLYVIIAIIVILIAGFMVVTMVALKKSFVTINNNIDLNDKEINQLINNQKVITDSILDLTELLDNFALQLFVNETEIEKLKQELNLPNNLKSYESIAENKGEN